MPIERVFASGAHRRPPSSTVIHAPLSIQGRSAVGARALNDHNSPLHPAIRFYCFYRREFLRFDPQVGMVL